ncbi:hypothetical protein F4774DRAFT_382760 [Daldinia eschscholtzii]|nr:hypothetical protein F4774DRAFT_382760 [Daldinia eschscholtzii]
MVRLFSGYLRRTTLRCIPGINGRSLPRRWQSIVQLGHPRFLHNETSRPENPESASTESDPAEPQTPGPWESYRSNFWDLQQHKPTPAIGYKAGHEVTIHGFIGRRRDVSANLSFCEINNAYDFGPQNGVQIVSSWKDDGSLQFNAHKDLLSIPNFSPVLVIGTLQEPPENAIKPGEPRRWDLKLRSIHCLNPFPKDIIVSKDAVWPPSQRYLQIRFDPLLRDRLRLRSNIQAVISRQLLSKRFIEVETPLLFKSTPEGAREFLVPTRRQGYAYALPQSPQQYKQMLMASGITRYFQFAKCFRDEDHRADRQPEFTQLDIEMAFSNSTDVMRLVSGLIERIFHHLHSRWSPTEINGIQHPVYVGVEQGPKTKKPKKENTTQGFWDRDEGNWAEETEFPEEDQEVSEKKFDIWEGKKRYPKFEFKDIKLMTYTKAMKHFGTDKPDLRINAPYFTNIRGSNNIKPPQDFVKKISNFTNPFVECFKVRLGLSPRDAGTFIRKFMDSLPNLTTVKLNPECTPGVFVFDSGQPLNGLSALGHESAERFVEFTETEGSRFDGCKDGDIIIFHARPRTLLQGGSTDIGRLRNAIYHAAVQEGLIPKDNSFHVVWVHQFPLFTPNEDNGDPGQGGTAGFSSTHHPFTAPLTVKDFFCAKDKPFNVKADNYDLVINGVEVGGGSRRIHAARHQDWILRDVLKMTDEGMAQFSHLLEALRAGCPPHAGFAFGFDRLIAVICDVPSVRDVIAFPKNNKGEDQMVGSPAKVTPEQQKTYHIFQEPEPESEVAESESKPVAEPEVESKLESESSEVSEPELESTSEPEPEPESKSESEQKSE